MSDCRGDRNEQKELRVAESLEYLRVQCPQLKGKLSAGTSQVEVLQNIESHLDSLEYLMVQLKEKLCGIPEEEQQLLSDKDLQECVNAFFELIGHLARPWWMRGRTASVIVWADTACYLEEKLAREREKGMEECSPTNEFFFAVALGLYGCAQLYYASTQYAKATSCCEKGVAYAENFCGPRQEQLVADLYNQWGMIAREQREYVKATAKHRLALRLYESSTDVWGQAHAISNLGVVEYRSGNSEAALPFHNKALEMREAVGDDLGIGSSLGNLGAIYVEFKDFEKAKELYEKSLKYRVRLKDKWGIAGSHVVLARVTMLLGKLQKSREYLKKSILGFEEQEDRLGFAESVEVATEVLLQSKMYEAAAVSIGISEIVRRKQEAPLPESHRVHQENAKTFLISELGGQKYNSFARKARTMSEKEMRVYILEQIIITKREEKDNRAGMGVKGVLLVVAVVVVVVKGAKRAKKIVTKDGTKAKREDASKKSMLAYEDEATSEWVTERGDEYETESTADSGDFEEETAERAKASSEVNAPAGQEHEDPAREVQRKSSDDELPFESSDMVDQDDLERGHEAYAEPTEQSKEGDHYFGAWSFRLNVLLLFLHMAFRPVQIFGVLFLSAGLLTVETDAWVALLIFLWLPGIIHTVLALCQMCLGAVVFFTPYQMVTGSRKRKTTNRQVLFVFYTATCWLMLFIECAAAIAYGIALFIYVMIVVFGRPDNPVVGTVGCGLGLFVLAFNHNFMGLVQLTIGLMNPVNEIRKFLF